MMNSPVGTSGLLSFGDGAKAQPNVRQHEHGLDVLFMKRSTDTEKGGDIKE